MDDIYFVTLERKIELDKEFEKEIFDLKNNIISREEFILCIKSKRLSFNDVCYLVSEYFGPIKIIEEKMNIPRIEEIEIIDEYNVSDICFDSVSTYNRPKISEVKRIKKIENMALRGKNYKKKQKIVV